MQESLRYIAGICFIMSRTVTAPSSEPKKKLTASNRHLLLTIDTL